MAQWSMHAYDADVWIPEFRGLNQADTGMRPDLRFASEAENVETPRGVLQPAAAAELMKGNFGSRVETLAVFHRRWYEGPGSRDWYVAASGGQLYTKQSGSDVDWMPIENPQGVEAFQSSHWSWVTYEESTAGGGTVDVLLMSNALDGMIMVTPPDRPGIWNDVLESTWANPGDETWQDDYSPQWVITTVETAGYKFGVIERYAERIWGGAIPGEPDTLVYSAPYDPTDWDQNEDIPEDGAGEVRQPTWDGDKFCALRRFGDRLLAFKRNKVWQVMGVSPGEFVFQEQYGGGTEQFDTIAVDGEHAYMANRNGIFSYDGMTVSPFMKEAIEKLWGTVSQKNIDQMCAAIFKRRYYLAVPVNSSPVNNAVIVFNRDEGTILYYPDVYIESFLPTEDDLFATSSTLPGRVLRVQYDSWETGAVSGAATKWVSPWLDMGRKDIQKGGFDLYFLPEVKDAAVAFSISIQTEKKTKTKVYTCQPRTEEQVEQGKEHKMKRLHFGGAGRKFRVIIETEAGVTVPWRIVGGLQLTVETDPD